MAATITTWNEYIEEIADDLRRHELPEEVIEEVTADMREDLRSGRLRRTPPAGSAYGAVEIRYRRLRPGWRAVAAVPRHAVTVVVLVAIVLSGALDPFIDSGALDRVDWWALAGMVGLVLLDAFGADPAFRRWADDRFDARTGAPVDVASGVRVVLVAVGYVLLLVLVATQILR